MPPHVHANPDFTDFEATDIDLGGDYHLAYRFGRVGEESQDALAPFLPLSISFGPPKLHASRQTLKYGLVRDFWTNIQAPSQADHEALMQAALRLLPEDIRAVEQGDAERLNVRRFVRP